MGRQNVDIAQSIFRLTYPNALETRLSEESHSKMRSPPFDKNMQLFPLSDWFKAIELWSS